MRKIRIMICAIFIIVFVIFVGYLLKIRQLEDHTPPVITCVEDTIKLSVFADDAELLKGVSAEDDKDGDITNSVRVSGMSHFTQKGKRNITYIVFDKANQAGTAERIVEYTDYTSPKIYLLKALRYSLNDPARTNVSTNMSAEDCLDGNITNQLRVSLGDNYFNAEAGDYEIIVQVTNSAGDVRAIPLQVTFVDESNRDESKKYYPTLSEYIVYTNVDTRVNLSSYITGVQKGNAVYTFEDDAEYLNFTKNAVKIQHEIDYSVPGTYPVEYSYTTEEGIKAVTRLYVVVEE